MNVNTREYEASHAKMPRGDGYWCFEVRWHDSTGERREQVWHNGKYGEAKKHAAQVARVRRAYEVRVMP